MNYITENPKATLTAFVGIALFVLNRFVFDFPPDVDVWIEIGLTAIFTFVFGYFNRLTKSEAKVLTQMEDNRNQL